MSPFSSVSSCVRRRSGPRLVALSLGLTLLASCGGGTSAYDAFLPLRLFSFGDEASVLTAAIPATPTAPAVPAGRNYGINGFNTNGTADDTTDDYPDCTVLPNWVQSLGYYYGFVFAECNPKEVVDPPAHNLSAPGARVAEVAAQVEAQVAAGGFRDKDVATVLVGVNDVVEQYRQYNGSNEAALLAELRERGNRAAAIVNRLIALGAKVIVVNIPDMGLTPLAKTEQAAHSDTDRAALLTRLSGAFNERLGVSILIDGRYVALVQLDQRVQAVARSPGSFALTNASDAACTTPPPDCTTATLVTGAGAGSHLWAGDVLLSYGGQAQLASLAIARAQRNPF